MEYSFWHCKIIKQSKPVLKSFPPPPNKEISLPVKFPISPLPLNAIWKILLHTRLD